MVNPNYWSLVYFDHSLQLCPYLKRNTGIGNKENIIAAKIVKPHPYPNESTRGVVRSGRNVLIRHRVTIKAVRAEAEYIPNASTTYVSTGKNANCIVPPKNMMVNRNVGTERRNWGTHPYRATPSDKVQAPNMTNGRRYSGSPSPLLRARSFTYVLSSVLLMIITLIRAPTPICILSISSSKDDRHPHHWTRVLTKADVCGSHCSGTQMINTFRDIW